MNRIRLLPEQVANQIAAGEVVERPASVVKELVENALDADARRITVEIQAGGRSLLRVIDDGVGMSRDDALLCLERHATSKIQRAEDLTAVATMGFRGEALPSIASVSRFTLTTRERDSQSPEGTQVVVCGGRISEVKAAGSAPGTTIEVRQLFFNLPARRKFLRTEETESAHIQHYLTLAALAHPGVAFTFQKEGRVIWQLPPVATGNDSADRLAALKERLQALQGGETKVLALDFAAPLEDHDEEQAPAAGSKLSLFRLWGFIGAPGVSRATREDQHLFVNRRPIENRGLNYALMEGYHTALMKGRYPVCCLFLEIDPAAFDVNIHPTKREVKFHREFEIRRLVTQAVRQKLVQFATPSAGPEKRAAQPAAEVPAPAPFPSLTGAGSPELGPEHQRILPNFPERLRPTPEAGRKPDQPSLRIGFDSGQRGAESAPDLNPAAVLPIAPPAAAALASSTPATPSSPAPSQATAADAGPTPLLNVPLRLLGVIGRLYVVLESDRGLVLLDQHAAHERILFEQMLNRLEEQGQAPWQKLLLPETVELSARDSSFLRQQLPALSRLGVGLSEFGERTFLLDALPPFVKVREPRRFVLELIDQLKAAGQEVNSLRLGEHVVAKTVCRHAVKANDPLAGAELQNLVEELRHCTMPYTCPHGRPTLIELNYRELEKKFGRTA
jgi:DNA mismatch repair protein MutL